MMLLAEAALRSFFLTGAVWLALKLLRVRNSRTQMAAWTGVLLASLAMPLLMRLAPARALTLPAEFYRLSPVSMVPAAPASGSTAPYTVFSRDTALLSAYLAVSMVLAAKLALGWVKSVRLLRRAARIQAGWTEGRDVRLSADLAMPVTIGRVIVLPVAFLVWDTDRRRAVIAHEASHAGRGDFYLLLLAGLHRALFWISPAAWWLDAALTDLAEANSDAAALAVSEDRLCYAQTLIDLAGRAPAGVAMARHATVGRRVERILAGGALPARLTAGRIALLAIGLIPAALAVAGVTPASDSIEEQRRPRTAIVLPVEALGKFTGYYAMNSAPDLPLHITLEGDHLVLGLFGQKSGEIFPESYHQFFSRDFPGQEDFHLDAAGRVDSVMLHWNGGVFAAHRIDEAAVARLEQALARRIAANRPQPGGEAALRSHIAQLQSGRIEEDSLAYGMGAVIRSMLPQIQPQMVALGPVVAVSFQGVGPDGMDIYAVTHQHGGNRWQIRLARDGRIESMWFSPLT